MKKYTYLIFLSVFLISCTPTKGLYTWSNYEKASYNYLKKSDEKSIDKLFNEYKLVINNQKGTRKVTPPGVSADYGFLLIQKGDLIKGKEYLKKEILLYPESKIFIDRILKLVENEK
jgi:hypothetical protein